MTESSSASEGSSSNHDPRIGRSKSTMDASTMPMPDAREIMKYGIVLPTTNIDASSGAIRTCSIVPRSFSRTIDSAVETTAVIIVMYAISPGTRNRVLRSSGLYQMRGSTETSGGAAAGW